MPVEGLPLWRCGQVGPHSVDNTGVCSIREPTERKVGAAPGSRRSLARAPKVSTREICDLRYTW